MTPRPEVEETDLVPGMPFHHHRPPIWIVRCCLGLAVLGALNLIGLGVSLYQDIVQQDYIEGRGEFRDREAQRMAEEQTEKLRQGFCDLLDQFPEGGLLERPRAKYGCGPGIPLENLTPEEQAQLNGRAQATFPSQRPQAQGGEVPDGPDALAPSPSAAPPPSASPPPDVEPAPQPPAQPAPILDLGVITDPLCDTLLICT